MTTFNIGDKVRINENYDIYPEDRGRTGLVTEVRPSAHPDKVSLYVRMDFNGRMWHLYDKELDLVDPKEKPEPVKVKVEMDITSLKMLLRKKLDMQVREYQLAVKEYGLNSQQAAIQYAFLEGVRACNEIAHFTVTTK